MDAQGIRDYNLRDGGSAFTVFAEAQPDRVAKARDLITAICREDPGASLIVEPGCSTGDICGFFSDTMNVIGIDAVPAAVEQTRQRWPLVDARLGFVEDMEPIECDILVLCEFLEHIDDPIGFCEAWLPKARHVVIGHPLVCDGFDPEPGHPWAYCPPDFIHWFDIGGFGIREAYTFSMGPYEMVIGRGSRA